MADSGFKFARLGGDGDDDHAAEGDGHQALADDIEKALHEGDSNSNSKSESVVMTAGGVGGRGGRGGGGFVYGGADAGVRGPGKGIKKSSLILMALIAVVCFLSILISSLAIKSVMALTPESDKIWTFAIGRDILNLHYVDPQTGEMDGFDVDMIETVCSIAGKTCRVVTDDYSHCWRSSETGDSGRGGQGLLAGWYDGCVGWSQTLERRRTFSFTEPFTKVLPSAFYVLPAKKDSFDVTDVADKRIGFLDGYADDQYCVNAQSSIQNVPLKSNQVFHFKTPDTALSALRNESIDAIFTTKYVNLSGAVALTTRTFNCSTRGRSIMTRKDSNLETWWNAAYAHLWASRAYHIICHTVEIRHGKFQSLTKEEICLHL